MTPATTTPVEQLREARESVVTCGKLVRALIHEQAQRSGVVDFDLELHAHELAGVVEVLGYVLRSLEARDASR